MADLLTHASLALLLKRGQQAVRPDRALHLPTFVAGNLLPDLLARLPAEVAMAVQARGVPVPPLLLHGWGVLHVPSGMALAALVLALLFPRPQQLAVFANLLLGMLLHLLVDLLQSHAGAGYLLFFPLSMQPYELGLVGSEATVFVAPLLVAAAAWAWREPLGRAWQSLRTARSRRA